MKWGQGNGLYDWICEMGAGKWPIGTWHHTANIFVMIKLRLAWVYMIWFMAQGDTIGNWGFNQVPGVIWKTLCNQTEYVCFWLCMQNILRQMKSEGQIKFSQCLEGHQNPARTSKLLAYNEISSKWHWQKPSSGPCRTVKRNGHL